MHTFHERSTICIAPDVPDLPDEYQIGLLLHEYGHLLSDRFKTRHKSEEAKADAVVRKALGIQIQYRSRLRLQYVPVASLP
jgi:hypothetical protein